MATVMWSKAYFTAGTIRGVSLRIHFSMLVGLAIACLHPFAAGLVGGYVTIVLLHELGHAALARAAGARIVGLDLSPLAGFCRWEGHVTPAWRALIAWGGVLAQLVIFSATVVCLKLFGFPKLGVLDGLAWAFTLENGFIMFINLLAVEPLDGFQAWKLPGLVWKKLRRPPRFEEVDLAKPRLNDRELSPDEMPDEIKQAVSSLLADAVRESRTPRRPPTVL